MWPGDEPREVCPLPAAAVVTVLGSRPPPAPQRQSALLLRGTGLLRPIAFLSFPSLQLPFPPFGGLAAAPGGTFVSCHFAFLISGSEFCRSCELALNHGQIFIVPPNPLFYQDFFICLLYQFMVMASLSHLFLYPQGLAPCQYVIREPFPFNKLRNER